MILVIALQLRGIVQIVHGYVIWLVVSEPPRGIGSI